MKTNESSEKLQTSYFINHPIRYIKRDDQFLFLSKDIAVTLGYLYPHQVMNKRVKDEKKIKIKFTTTLTFIDGDTALDVIERSRKPNANKLYKWLENFLEQDFDSNEIHEQEDPNYVVLKNVVYVSSQYIADMMQYKSKNIIVSRILKRDMLLQQGEIYIKLDQVLRYLSKTSVENAEKLKKELSSKFYVEIK
ncbi:hypothetical protein KLEB273_gp159 [Bacillus phage vB_BauM_KLEB27-3]|nr:hypothetical protein KLEB273_gp159 [Bacillus phage vB_BauM_KLEB27-3]